MCEVKKHNVITTSEGIGTEIHPFNNPDDLKGAKYLIVGTFPPHRFVSGDLKQNDVNWFYGSQDNSFWDLLGELVGKFDSNAEQRKEKCKLNQIAFLDLFQVIMRYGTLSGDEDIFPIEIVDLVYYLEKNEHIEFVLFTSKWVEKIAKKEYLRKNNQRLKENGKKTDYIEDKTFYRFECKSNVKVYTLPSPSPSNGDSFSGKKSKWEQIFDEIGFSKKTQK